MKAHRSTVLQTKEASYLAKITAYGTVKGALSSFQTAVNALSSASLFKSLTATSSDTSVLSAYASTLATPGNYAISVTNLAQSQNFLPPHRPARLPASVAARRRRFHSSLAQSVAAPLPAASILAQALRRMRRKRQARSRSIVRTTRCKAFATQSTRQRRRYRVARQRWHAGHAVSLDADVHQHRPVQEQNAHYPAAAMPLSPACWPTILPPRRISPKPLAHKTRH